MVPAGQQGHVILFSCGKDRRHRLRQKISVYIRTEIEPIGPRWREGIEQFLRRNGP